MRVVAYLFGFLFCLTGVAHADVVEQLKEMSIAAEKLRAISHQIAEASIVYYPWEDTASGDDKKGEALHAMALSTISPCFNSAAFSIEQIVLMHFAFVESPHSTQAQKLKNLCRREVQHLYYMGNYVHMLFSDMFDSMEAKDKELCKKGMKLIEHSLDQLKLIVGAPV